MGNGGNERALEMIRSVPHWHHQMELLPGLHTPGAYNPQELFERLQLGDLRGRRVLDVGARDGYFSFECERRGADVVAIDSDVDVTGFRVAKDIIGSRVECHALNVYDLEPGQFGYFDVILFLGVLYHLRHPLLALDRLRSVALDLLIVESFVCDQSVFVAFNETRALTSFSEVLGSIPLAQFLPHGRFHPDWTNKWAPNLACLNALISDASFKPVKNEVWGARALVHAVATADSNVAERTLQDSKNG